MATRTSTFTALRVLLLGVSILVGAAPGAHAAPLTLNFSGSLDLSSSGGAADNPFSGFFTWDTEKTPFETDGPSLAMYQVEAYQFILNGVAADQSLGAGMFVVDDGNFFGTGNIDAFVFLATINRNPGVGDTLFIGALYGPTTSWNTLSLPQDYSFLSLLTERQSGLSLEVPFGGDENDVFLGGGSYAARPPRGSVPEPTTFTLTALGLVGLVAQARRARQRRGQ